MPFRPSVSKIGVVSHYALLIGTILWNYVPLGRFNTSAVVKTFWLTEILSVAEYRKCGTKKDR